MATGTVAQTITLHIGTEKTGSTTIQHLCGRNRAVLRAAGLLYPSSTGNRVANGLKRLALNDWSRKRANSEEEDADAPQDEATLMARLRQEIEEGGCRHVLFSHEHFSSRLREAESVHRLVAALRTLAEEVRVIVFLRPQYELFPSSYSTLIKAGGTDAATLPENANRKFYNYDLMLQLWEEAVGAGNIAVRRFGRSYFKDGDLIATFFDALGMDVPADLKTGRAKNTALDAPTLEFLRLSNIQLQHMTEAAQGNPRIRLIKTLEGLAVPGGAILPAELLGRMDELFAPSNSRVAERYFPGVDRLFPPFNAAAAKPVEPLTSEKAVEIALALLQQPKRMFKLPASKGKAARKAAGRLAAPERAQKRRDRKLARTARADAAAPV